MRWAGHVVHIKQKRNSTNMLARKHEGMIQFGRYRTLQNNIKMHLKWDARAWTG
jgi:hypothetical protein